MIIILVTYDIHKDKQYLMDVNTQEIFLCKKICQYIVQSRLSNPNIPATKITVTKLIGKFSLYKQLV